MKYLLIFAGFLLSDSALPSPTLGEPQDIVVTATGSEPNNPLSCKFSLTPRQVQAFLQKAIIITPRENHDNFYYGPCYVSGTATIRGNPVTWEIRSLGTGHITFYEEYTFMIADPKMRYEMSE
ncbi:MAG: hypothetical protein LBF16_10940 [Pseudomonadales bacterium]|jgi:hypothetical protein|nr:hypothetical protein [Pseudomonadales bacterium]